MGQATSPSKVGFQTAPGVQSGKGENGEGGNGELGMGAVEESGHG